MIGFWADAVRLIDGKIGISFQLDICPVFLSFSCQTMIVQQDNLNHTCYSVKNLMDHHSYNVSARNLIVKLSIFTPICGFNFTFVNNDVSRIITDNGGLTNECILNYPCVTSCYTSYSNVYLNTISFFPLFQIVKSTWKVASVVILASW